ncbi:MAG: hypothetical protein Tsb009_12020 [Planctomycetaceae bacterium]
MNRSFTRIALFSAVLFTTCFSSLKTASATTFINLSNRTVYVAQASYEPYSSRPDVTPARYFLRGWYAVRSGDVVNLPTTWMYVKDSNGRALTWRNLRTIPGMVKRGKFSAYLSKNPSRTEIRMLRDRGFKTVRFMGFGNGTYTIRGTAHRIRTVNYRFSHESRSLKFINKSFRPGGKIAGYSVSYSSNKWANVRWGIQNDGQGVYYGGSIQGKQVRPFGPREKAKFIGTVTIRYLTRN